MEVARFALTHALEIALLALASFLLGRRVLARLEFANALEEVAVSTGMGLGLLGLAVLALGAVGLIYPLTMALLLAAPLLLGAGVLRAAVGRIRRAIAKGVRSPVRGLVVGAAVLAMSLAALALFAIALYPPRVWDAISYHLPLARSFLETHSVGVAPQSIRFAVFPNQVDALFVPMLGLFDDVAAQTVSWLATVLCAVGLAGWGARLGAPVAGAVAAAGWLGSPLVVLLSGTAYVDVGLALFVMLAAASLCVWLETSSTAWLLTCAAFAGFAAGTKYHALALVGVLALVVGIRGLRRRAWRPLLLAAGVLALTGGAWYARSAALTGNPVFPFASRFFANSYWSDQDNARLRAGAGSTRTIRDIATFARMPWDLVTDQQRFHGEGRLSRPVLAAVPLSLVLLLVRPRSRVVVAMVLSYTVFWFFTAPSLRYLLAIVPLLAILAGLLVDAALSAVRLGPASAGVCAAVIAAAIAYPGLRWAHLRWTTIGVPPANHASRQAFLERFPSYRLYSFLNAQHGSDYRVLGLGDEYMAHYAEGWRIGDVVGAAAYDTIHTGSGQALLADMQRLDVRYLIDVGQMAMPADETFRSRFVLRAATARARLYEVVPGEMVAELGPPLIRNQSLEDGADGVAAEWLVNGSPEVVNAGALGGSGRAVRIRPRADCLFQRVEVSPGHLYRLTLAGRGGASAEAVVIVRWTDEERRTLGRDVFRRKIGIEWQRLEFVATAPQGAAQAVLELQSLGRDVALYDEVEMRDVVYVQADGST